MMDIYTNRSSKKDFIKNGLTDRIEDGMEVLIASAFFTDYEAINTALENNCHVKIIVRLGFPTSPVALEKLIQSDSVDARFYTSNSFHPKMYIFGDKSLLVGSANLTKSALISNQEIMVGLSSDDPRFEELTHLFLEYWKGAEVLNKEAIQIYKAIYEQYREIPQLITDLDTEVINKLGNKVFSNINRVKKKSTQKELFLDTYRKTYQESISGFRKIEEIYSLKNRKVDESQIPLRLEIDSFISFVRDGYAKNENWKNQPIGWNDISKSLTSELIDKWLLTDWEHFESQIVPINYPLINSYFGSLEAISSASAEDIVNTLCVLHSFHDRLRFFKGGLENLKATFIASNDIDAIKRTLNYLLHGKGEVISRMYDCIYGDYKLNEFGKANVQELIGWISNENLPVINGRTTRACKRNCVTAIFGF